MSNVAREAGRLLNFALHNPPISPARSADYARLIDSFDLDDRFRDEVKAMADGLGLRLLDVNNRGVFLAPKDETSPFRMKLDQINSSLSDHDLRQLFGLALTVISAIFFQTSVSLSEDSLSTVTVKQAREEMLHVAKMRQAEINAGDEDYSDLDTACKVLLNKEETASTPTGQTRRDTLTYWIEAAFARLEKEGFVKKRSEVEGGGYTAYTRYRIHMREFMCREAYSTAVRILNKQESDLLDSADQRSNEDNLVDTTEVDHA